MVEQFQQYQKRNAFAHISNVDFIFIVILIESHFYREFVMVITRDICKEKKILLCIKYALLVVSLFCLVDG